MFPARRVLVPAVRKLIDFLAGNLDGAEIHAHPCSLDILRAGQVR